MHKTAPVGLQEISRKLHVPQIDNPGTGNQAEKARAMLVQLLVTRLQLALGKVIQLARIIQVESQPPGFAGTGNHDDFAIQDIGKFPGRQIRPAQGNLADFGRFQQGRTFQAFLLDHGTSQDYLPANHFHAELGQESYDVLVLAYVQGTLHEIVTIGRHQDDGCERNPGQAFAGQGFLAEHDVADEQRHRMGLDIGQGGCQMPERLYLGKKPPLNERLAYLFQKIGVVIGYDTNGMGFLLHRKNGQLETMTGI